MGYALATQLFPALLMSLARRRHVSAAGAMAGIVAGVLVVAVMTAESVTMADLAPWLPFGLTDLNVGVVALALNVGVVAAVSWARPGALPLDPAKDSRP